MKNNSPGAVKNQLLSTVFFLLTFLADLAATHRGTGGEPKLECNIVVRWFWEQLGNSYWILPLVWVGLVAAIAYLLQKINRAVALWWLNAVAAAHLIGFISWTPFDIIKICAWQTSRAASLALSVVPAAILGFLLMKLQIHLARRRNF